jgi:hypothetical protein
MKLPGKEHKKQAVRDRLNEQKRRGLTWRSPANREERAATERSKKLATNEAIDKSPRRNPITPMNRRNIQRTIQVD